MLQCFHSNDGLGSLITGSSHVRSIISLLIDSTPYLINMSQDSPLRCSRFQFVFGVDMERKPSVPFVWFSEMFIIFSIHSRDDGDGTSPFIHLLFSPGCSISSQLSYCSCCTVPFLKLSSISFPAT